MRTLYHLWLSPFSRKIRIALAEKKLDFELKAENPSERRAEFHASHAGAPCHFRLQHARKERAGIPEGHPHQQADGACRLHPRIGIEQSRHHPSRPLLWHEQLPAQAVQCGLAAQDRRSGCGQLQWRLPGRHEGRRLWFLR